MSKCANCGHEVALTARACPNCGSYWPTTGNVLLKIAAIVGFGIMIGVLFQGAS